MAYNNHTASAVLLLTLLLFMAANPFVYGQTNTFRVPGRLCCTSTGNCPGQGVRGATVQLNCTVSGGTVNIGTATTNALGSFTIIGSVPQGLTLTPTIAPCLGFVRLPLNSTVCPVLSINGVLIFPVRVLLPGSPRVQLGIAGPFIRIPA